MILGGGELPPIHGSSGMCHCLVMELRVGLRLFQSVLSNTHIFGGILFLAFKNVEPSKTIFAGPFCHIMFQQPT